jgi:hypothetical protein
MLLKEEIAQSAKQLDCDSDKWEIRVWIPVEERDFSFPYIMKTRP